MKVSLIALVAGCAVAGSAFAATSPVSANRASAQVLDSPHTNPPHASVLDSPHTNPPHASVLDSPHTNPPHAAI
jgi:hypothetical protein